MKDNAVPLSTVPNWARALRPFAYRWPEHRGRWRLLRFLHSLVRWPKVMLVDMPDGRHLELNLTDIAHWQAYWTGHYELRTEQIISRFVRPGDTFIDGGANVGLFSTLASRLVGPAGQVHCFEPLEMNLSKLRRNVEINGFRNTVVNVMALGEHPGHALIHEFDNLTASQSSLSSLGRSDGRTRSCSVVRLDDYVRENRLEAIRFIKLDIEGAEWAALRGAEATLQTHRPILCVELNESTAAAFEYHPYEMVRWLMSLGYYPCTVGRNRLQRVDVRLLGVNAENALLVPSDFK